MANPPDNKNPGNNDPQLPKTGSTTPGANPQGTINTENTGQGGKPAPAKNTDLNRTRAATSAPQPTETPPPLPKTPIQKPPVPKTPAPKTPVPSTDETQVRSTPSTPVSATPGKVATGSATAGTTTSTATANSAQSSTTRRAADSSVTKTAETETRTRSSTLERPRADGASKPEPRRPNQLTRPARPLERTAAPRPEGAPAGRRPERPSGGQPAPARRPAENRPHRGPARREEHRRPAYRDSRPRRRMAPPPGAKTGRYVAPAMQPTRRGHVVPPAAAAPGGSAWAPLLFGILLLCGVLWYAIKYYTPMIKSDLTARTNSALQSAGYGDVANVEIDGRNAILTGSVASETDSESAEEIVANTEGVRTVDNQLTIGETDSDATAGERTEPALTFFASDDGVKLSGTVSDQEYADQIENHAKEIYGEDGVSGSITVDPNSTNPGWWPAVQQLSPDLKNVDGSFNVSDGALRLTGQAADQQTKDDINAKAEELLNGQLTIDNRITVAATAEPTPEPAPEPEPQPEPESQPEPQPEPVTLQPASANYYNTGKIIQLNGSLPAESAASLADAFANAELPVANRINISDEVEAPAWVDSFGEAVEALQNIEQAEIDVQPDGDVAVYGIATSEEAMQAAADKVASIFADQDVNNQISVRAPEPEPEPEPVAPSMQPFASVSDDGTTLTIAGLLPPSAAEALGGSFENSGRSVVSNVTADERVMQPEWTDALATTLQAMNGIENSKIMIAASGTLTLSGLADSAADRQRAANAGFDAFGNSVSLLNDITVKGPDITQLLASIDLAAIRFRSGSSELDADSVSILEQVAGALEQVPDATVAISGHTDSTGSANRNLVLSGQRADRVRSFLIERGISGDRLTSQGFGSSQPIASNDTVTGRALNRRIDIALTNGE